MLKSVGIRTSALRHASHHGDGIDLTARTGGSHVSSHLGWYTWLSARLTGIMSHTRSSHGMAGMNTWMLLH